MMRQEKPREDLLRDAMAYPVRILLSVDRVSDQLFAGFRSAGDLSLYLEEDPVLQFNSRGELRRLYWRGEKYMAENKRLWRLTRARAQNSAAEDRRVQFLQTEVDPSDSETLRVALEDLLQRMDAGLNLESTRILGAIPPEQAGAILARLQRMLKSEVLPLRFAQSRRVGAG